MDCVIEADLGRGTSGASSTSGAWITLIPVSRTGAFASPSRACQRVQIYYLNKATQPELQRHINGLPALFLDCDDDIDLERDTGAKARYAQQISEFSGFVRRLQARRCAPRVLC